MSRNVNEAIVDEIRDRIRRGSVVHTGFAGGIKVWWIESPLIYVDERIMKKASVGENGHSLLVEAGDSLFGWPGNSQRWRPALG